MTESLDPIVVTSIRVQGFPWEALHPPWGDLPAIVRCHRHGQWRHSYVEMLMLGGHLTSFYVQGNIQVQCNWEYFH